MGSPTTTVIGARRIRIRSAGIAFWVPHTATGTSGAPVRIESQAAPRLSGTSPHSETLRPSGNTPTAPARGQFGQGRPQGCDRIAPLPLGSGMAAVSPKHPIEDPGVAP